MKSIAYSVIFLLVLSIMLPSFAANTATPDQKSKATASKGVFLTTEDIKEAYKVIGVISVRGGDVNLDSLNDKLKEQAESLGADCVIGVNYFNYSGYVFAFGTAVKVKE